MDWEFYLFSRQNDFNSRTGHQKTYWDSPSCIYVLPLHIDCYDKTYSKTIFSPKIEENVEYTCIQYNIEYE